MCLQIPRSRASLGVHLSVGQAKLLTLQLGKHCPGQTSPRIEFLDNAFFDAVFSVVFIQEAHTSGPVVRLQSSYHAVVGGCAPRAVLGGEIWLARIIPKGCGGSIHIDMAGVIVCNSPPNASSTSRYPLTPFALLLHLPMRLHLALPMPSLRSSGMGWRALCQLARPGWPLIAGIEH